MQPFKYLVPIQIGIASSGKCQLLTLNIQIFNYDWGCRRTIARERVWALSRLWRTNGIKFWWTCTLEKIVQRDPWWFKLVFQQWDSIYKF